MKSYDQEKYIISDACQDVLSETFQHIGRNRQSRAKDCFVRVHACVTKKYSVIIPHHPCFKEWDPHFFTEWIAHYLEKWCSHMITETLPLQPLGKNCYNIVWMNLQYSVQCFIMLNDENMRIQNNDLFLRSKGSILLTTFISKMMWLMVGFRELEVFSSLLRYHNATKPSYTASPHVFIKMRSNEHGMFIDIPF